MAKTKQLTVPCVNRPGTLARVTKTLGDSKVNILAFRVSTLGAEGRVQLIVDNVNRAKKALDAARFSYTLQNVLHVALPNKAGALGSFAGKLAAKGININAGYATTVKGSKKATVVFGVSDLKKAARVR